MSFSPVLPTTYTPQTDRVTLVAALEALVDAYIAQAGYTLGRAWRTSLPASFTGEGPLIVLGDIIETVTHDWQIRRTVFSGQLFYVDFVTDPDEVSDRVDAWSDYMRDLFTYNSRLVDPSAVLQEVSFAEGEFTQGQLVFAAPSISFTYTIQEGYQ